MEELKPCPFCGGSGKLLDNGYEEPVIDENGAYVDMDISEPDIFWCQCKACGAMTVGKETKEGTIEEWNHRVKLKFPGLPRERDKDGRSKSI